MWTLPLRTHVHKTTEKSCQKLPLHTGSPLTILLRLLKSHKGVGERGTHLPGRRQCSQTPADLGNYRRPLFLAGFGLLAEYRGRGLSIESLDLICGKLPQTVKRMDAHTDSENPTACSLYQKYGFVILEELPS